MGSNPISLGIFINCPLSMKPYMYSFYIEKTNISLLMGLGAHIGHAKIDWNTDNNAYLAGLTNNNYIIFNINKTLFLFKRVLLFMKLVGYNNGKFVIYYPGDNSFYKLVMEGALDKEGLMPSKYPFIHSLVKPGFFSNWRINYKRLVNRFFKVIFYNPYFFGSLITKILNKQINENIFKFDIDKRKINRLRLQRRKFVRNVSKSTFIRKYIKRSDKNEFKFPYRISKSLLGKKMLPKYFDFKIKAYRFNSLILKNRSRIFTVLRSKHKHRKLLMELPFYYKERLGFSFSLFFFKLSNYIDKICIIHRHKNRYDKFLITNKWSNNVSEIICFYRESKLNKSKLLNELNNNYKEYINFSYKKNISLFYNYLYDLYKTRNYKNIIRYYQSLNCGNEKTLRDFLNKYSINVLIFVERIKKKKKIISNFKKKLIYILAKIKKLEKLTMKQNAVKHKRRYYNKLFINNKWIFKNFLKRLFKDDTFYNNNKLKYRSDKIHTYFNYLIDNKKYYFLKKKAKEKVKRYRLDSLKMLYYNIYDILINIALRREKYKNNRDSLTPYEQKLFRKFVKFVLIFRYLKRIRKVPTSVFLLNPTAHESQITDFMSLNTAVIGITDSNISFGSLSYYIPSNDDNFILFLYYVKMIASSFNSGRKSFITNKLTPKFINNVSNTYNYSNYMFPYQYREKINNKDLKFTLLPYGSPLDMEHTERLKNKQKERESKTINYKKFGNINKSKNVNYRNFFNSRLKAPTKYKYINFKNKNMNKYNRLEHSKSSFESKKNYRRNQFNFR